MRQFRRVIAAVALAATAATTLAACGSDEGGDGGDAKTLKLWHYESENSAMGIAWDRAIQIFKDEHPGVEVQFERKAFEQIQQNAGMIINSS
ncbi:carbohydrate ABC transporter substrate-binding protein, partial [Micromonospora musae]